MTTTDEGQTDDRDPTSGEHGVYSGHAPLATWHAGGVDLRLVGETPLGVRAPITNGRPTLDGMVIASHDLASVRRRIVDAALDTVEGFDLGSLTIEASKGMRTEACTDPVVQDLADVQHRSGRGPTVSALGERTTQICTTVTSDVDRVRWPEFCEAARAADVKTTLSIPLIADDSLCGALNLFAVAEHEFTCTKIEIATAMARRAAVVLANATDYWSMVNRAQNLEVALESRDVIGQAKGILVSSHGISDDEAFALLRGLSHRFNRKVRNVAEEMVREAHAPPPPEAMGA